MAKGEIGKIVGVGAVATALGGAYKFGEFVNKAKRMHDVGPANAVYVRLISRVRADLDEVKRLLTVPEIKFALQNNRPKAEWVYGAIRDMRGALENISPHTERVGGDIEGGRRVGLRHRLRWLLDEKEKLENREREVSAAHTSLCEVIGFLTALEPLDERERKGSERLEVDVDVHREGPSRYEEREVWAEGRGPGSERRVEERETYIETERGPRAQFEEREAYVERGPRTHVEERDVYVERGRGPHTHVEEREVYIERERERRPQSHTHIEERETFIDRDRAPRSRSEGRGAFVRHHDDHDEHDHKHRLGRLAHRIAHPGQHHHHHHHHEDRRVEERDVYIERRDGPRRVEERHLHIERDPRDPRHVEATYSSRGPAQYEESRYEERRYGPNDEDRVPQRESFMSGPPPPRSRGPYGEYAEYGAPQPSGAANYSSGGFRRHFQGDPGFGDEEVLNPQPVPPLNANEREVWVEEREDYRFDQYGNRLPERMLPGRLERTRYPVYPKSVM
ncbi:hypothetical protein BCR34DRAFT_565433, partial [Clohesyomyces aquaticus]